jgi:exopolysaccharide production protein ExoZ
MQKQLTNIQMLRALAALNVVVYHTIDTAQSYSMPSGFLGVFDNWGKNGVDLFFVISGFIMVYVQHLKNRNAIDFLRDRVVRIVPTYWVMSLFMGALLLALPSVARELTFSAGWLVSSLFFVSGLVSDSQPILYLGWSIEYEMLFYVVFAGSLMLGSLKNAVLATVVLLSGLSFYHVNNTILLEFVFGILIGWWYVNHRTPKVWGMVSFVLGLGTFLGSLAFKDSGIDRVILYGLPSALIVFGLVNVAQYENRLLTALGDASYGIYLIQVFTIPVFFKGLLFLGLQHLSLDWAVVGSLIITSAAGYVFYRYIEMSMQKKIKSLMS